ncbi:MAG: hypothetical protein J0L80_03140 [Chitinophagales bacterium]|nr:hypothetical protein [Chitinophagales bacterium]
MTPEEQLDCVLNILNEQYSLDFKDVVIFNSENEISNTYKTIIPKSKSLTYSLISFEIADIETRNELEILLNYLIENKLVSTGGTPMTNTYGITFLGRKMLKEGGFVAKSIRDAKALEAKMYRDYLMILGTWMAGIGGAGIVLVEILKKADWMAGVNLSRFSFVLLSGLILGIGLQILISERLTKK